MCCWYVGASSAQQETGNLIEEKTAIDIRHLAFRAHCHVGWFLNIAGINLLWKTKYFFLVLETTSLFLCSPLQSFESWGEFDEFILSLRPNIEFVAHIILCTLYPRIHLTSIMKYDKFKSDQHHRAETMFISSIQIFKWKFAWKEWPCVIYFVC